MRNPDNPLAPPCPLIYCQMTTEEVKKDDRRSTKHIKQMMMEAMDMESQKCDNLEIDARNQVGCIVTGKTTLCNGDAKKCTTGHHPELTDWQEEAR
mgnify:CR=1 FL=1